MAEGMISSEDRGTQETLRDVAERYLFELANRCMVRVKTDEGSIYNRFKTCRLHDMIRELCLSKAKDEEFLRVVDMGKGSEDEASMCRISRLVVHLDGVEDDHIKKNQNLRSLLSLQRQWGNRHWNNFGGVDFGMFKFLRILIFEGHRFKNRKLPEGVEKLILLKHLSIRDSEVDELPKSLCMLSCLQSLDLRVRCSIKLLNFIHKMRHLRHQFLHDHSRSIIGGGKLKLDGLNELETLVGFDSRTDETSHLLKLSKLQVLHGKVADDEGLSMIVGHVLNNQDQFREIQLIIHNYCNINSEEGSNLLKKMVTCRSLSWLDIWCRVSKLPTYEPELYRNMVTLLLSGSNIEKDPMEILEKLPMLRDLRFFTDAYAGREMVCSATGFRQLRRLRLDGLPNLEEWTVEEGAMPNLFSLCIYNCYELKMIHHCSERIVHSCHARKIHEQGTSGGW
ncbi:putative disease resistance protein RXW24L [Sesamum angolense]|uniref:Disease resistance protein RXW24L n=1 Tax=Sesamum angolense TaxID=2727404 RepID=A0AAE1X7J3_9LAMI|nr:putative disease resistance protein RXW24L [Sesamum angolense]